MKPILFDKDAMHFNTNGLGRLDCISCEIIEERNGIFEMEMTIAESANHASEIEMNSIVVAKMPDKTDLQAFRVYQITKPINGQFSVYAQHISYQLSFITTMPFSIAASANACAETLAALKTNAVEVCPFNFTTDVTTVSSYNQVVPSTIRSRLGGVQGSVLDQFGGEYEWDNFNVILHRRRGKAVPTVTLRYGKNITDINQEENIADTITGIVPYWQSSEGGTVVTLPEKVIESQYADVYPFKRTVPYNFSDKFETEPTQAQLRARAQSYMNASGVGVPKVSIKLSFINLSDTEEYKDIAALQDVSLCDNINIYFEKLGINTSAEIVKVKYDVLAERYNSIEVGSLRSSLSSTINANSQGITELANNTHRMFQEYNGTVNQLIDEATTWLTSGDGFVVAHKDPNTGEWKELLFMDTADEATAHNVLRINQNGIGFSSTGVAGPYTQAWTLDGRMVIGGTNVPSLTVYDNATPPNIIFQTSQAGTIWNSQNSSMSATGVLRAVGAILTNAEIISTTTTGAGIDVNANNGKIVFLYNNTEIATIVAKKSPANEFHLDVTSEDYISINADEDIHIKSGDVVISSDEDTWMNSQGLYSIIAQQNIDITSTNSNIDINADETLLLESDNGNVEVNADNYLFLNGNNDVDINAPNGKITLGSLVNINGSDFEGINESSMYFELSGSSSSHRYEDVVTNLTIDWGAGYATWSSVDVIDNDTEYQLTNQENNMVLTVYANNY